MLPREAATKGIGWTSVLLGDYGYDFGDASDLFFIAADTIHGAKTLPGEAGTFTIRLQAQLTWTGPTTGLAEGRIVIDSDAGGYEKLYGISETYAEINLESG